MTKKELIRKIEDFFDSINCDTEFIVSELDRKTEELTDILVGVDFEQKITLKRKYREELISFYKRMSSRDMIYHNAIYNLLFTILFHKIENFTKEQTKKVLYYWRDMGNTEFTTMNPYLKWIDDQIKKDDPKEIKKVWIDMVLTMDTISRQIYYINDDNEWEISEAEINVFSTKWQEICAKISEKELNNYKYLLASKIISFFKAFHFRLFNKTPLLNLSHYTTGANIQKILKYNSLGFSKINNLNDPTEGSFSRDYILKYLQEYFSKDFDFSYLSTILEKAQKSIYNFYSSSWTKNEDQIPMWSFYAGSNGYSINLKYDDIPKFVDELSVVEADADEISFIGGATLVSVGYGQKSIIETLPEMMELVKKLAPTKLIAIKVLRKMLPILLLTYKDNAFEWANEIRFVINPPNENLKYKNMNQIVANDKSFLTIKTKNILNSDVIKGFDADNVLVEKEIGKNFKLIKDTKLKKKVKKWPKI